MHYGGEAPYSTNGFLFTFHEQTGEILAEGDYTYWELNQRYWVQLSTDGSILYDDSTSLYQSLNGTNFYKVEGHAPGTPEQIVLRNNTQNSSPYARLSFQIDNSLGYPTYKLTSAEVDYRIPTEFIAVEVTYLGLGFPDIEGTLPTGETVGIHYTNRFCTVTEEWQTESGSSMTSEYLELDDEFGFFGNLSAREVAIVDSSGQIVWSYSEENMIISACDKSNQA